MIQALVRKAFANLRSRRLQTVILFVILTLATALLTLAVAVQQAAANPWQRTFDQTQGAHIWFSTENRAALASIGDIANVIGTAGPYRAVINTPDSQTWLTGFERPLVLLARPAGLEKQVGQVLMVEGRWLAAGATSEFVLDRVLAEEAGLAVGDLLTLQRSGREVTGTVVGLAYNPAPVLCPRDSGEGICAIGTDNVVYLLPETLSKLESDEGAGFWIQGVRLADPEAVDYVKTAVQNSLPAGVEMGSITWLRLRDRQIEEIQFSQVVLTVFSVFALGLAGFILMNVVGGQILGEYHEIALLKSIGFRPQEISLLYLVSQVALGAVAAIAGIALALPLIPGVVGRVNEVLNATDTELVTPPLLAAVAGGVLLLVALFTLLPAWGAGRANTAQAIASGYSPPMGRASLPTRLAIALRLPLVVVLGVKDAFARPLRAALSIAVITVGVITITFVLSVEATIQRAIDDPSLFGNFPVDVMAQIEGAPVGDEEAGDSAQALNEKTRAFLETSPAVASFISHGIVRAVWEGTEDIFLVRALGDDLGLVFPARKGRRLAADGEAMVSQSVASEKGIGVGDEFTLLVGDNSVPLCVVGVYFDGPGNEPTILTTMETLARARITVTVDAYGVQATSTEVVGQLMSELSQATGPRVEAYSVREALDQGIIAIRSLSYILDLVLLAIVAANVLATASLTVRERFRDLATMKMLGMTPRQVARSVTSGSLALSLVAVMAGLPLGLAVTRWLIEIISRQVGLDQGIARLPGLPWLAIIVPVTLLVVAAGSALPARLAGRLPVAEALRME